MLKNVSSIVCLRNLSKQSEKGQASLYVCMLFYGSIGVYIMNEESLFFMCLSAIIPSISVLILLVVCVCAITIVYV